MRATADAPASVPVLYQELQDDARLAEALGFHSLWLSEHHFWYDGWCPSLLVAGAAVLAVTTRLHVGTGVFLLPLHEPERIAAAGHVLERLAPGRLELGVGLGYREAELDAFGISRKQRGHRADLALERLKEAWPEGSPRIWIGGISDKSLARAHGGHSLFLPSTMSDDQLSDVVDRLRRAADQSGVTPGRVGMLKNAWITDGSQREEREARAAIAASTKEYAGAWWMLSGTLGFDAPDLLDKQLGRAASTALVGPPETIIEGLRALERIGVDLVALHIASDSTRPAYREAMRRLAADVLPEVT